MSGVSDALAALQAMAHGQAPGASTGPSASNALGGNFVDGKAPVVYWGPSNVIHTNTSGRDSSAQEEGDKQLGITRNRPGDNTMPLQNAVADWYTWSDQERGDFAKRLYKVGLISDPGDLYGQGGAFAQWQNAVQTASNFYTFAKRKVTPWQAVDLMANTANGGQKSKTQTNTSRSFNIPTVEDAHAATRSIFQALMGRDPQGDELDRYASMMTAYAQKHPTITKQTQTTDIHGNTTSSSTSSGGYSQQGMTDLLSNQAKADPEYGSYTAAVPLWNALMSAIGGTGHGG